MEIEEMAIHLAKVCSRPNLNSTDYAIQLFIELHVLPKSLRGYTCEEMEKYILTYLSLHF